MNELISKELLVDRFPLTYTVKQSTTREQTRHLVQVFAQLEVIWTVSKIFVITRPRCGREFKMQALELLIVVKTDAELLFALIRGLSVHKMLLYFTLKPERYSARSVRSCSLKREDTH